MSAGDFEQQLIDELGACSGDPLRFVLFAFPWGEPGTDLVDRSGPYEWQVKVLEDIKKGLPIGQAIQEAVASGHGVGKSALVAWIILWAISTCEDCRGVVTANTEVQLKSKTWAELGKWHRMFIGSHLFKLTATALYAPSRERTWRVDMIPWSKEKPEAFAGLHNQGKRIVLIFDEASAIDDIIWEVSEGALTDKDTQIVWCCFGNPTKNKGRFKECFTSRAERWNQQQVDSRLVPNTNLEQIQKWEKDYGEDSDFFRVRVRGLFPNTSSIQLIDEASVASARSRAPVSFHYEPLIFGLDVARFGDNESVLVARRGRDARTVPAKRFRGLSTDQLGDIVATEIAAASPDAVFIDEGGVGGGVVDYLRRLGYDIIGVNFGGKAGSSPNGTLVANKRAEMWVRLAQWIRGDVAIENSEELAQQLLGTGYSFNKRSEILLDDKAVLDSSPDWADALALTFAHPVAFAGKRASREVKMDYDPYNESSAKQRRIVNYGGYQTYEVN